MADVSTTLSVERTRLSYERTLMAWVRTSASLISFGFTIHKFFQFLREQSQVAPPDRLITSRGFAMIMIVIGMLALVMATAQHVGNIRKLRAEYAEVPYSLATWIAGVVGGLGALGLLTVIFRQ